MTIQSNTSRITYTGDNVSTVFTVPFLFFANIDITVVKTAVGGGVATLALNVDYTLTGAGVTTGGTLTKTTALLTGETLGIFLDPPRTQLSHYLTNDIFPAATLETNLDREVQISQRLYDLITRAIRAPDSDNNPQLTLPSAVARALKYVTFDANGDLSLAQSLPAGTLSQASIGSFLYPQTAAEAAVSVTPTSLFYPSGNVLRYGADSTGVADSATAFLKARQVATQGNIELLIPGGIYKSTATLVWGFTNLQVTATGKVVINFTNAGQCITLDGGAAGPGIVGVTVKGYIRAVGNASTTDAWFVRACHHSYLTMRAGDCFVGLRVNWCVATKFDFVCSSNEAAFSVLVPTTGMFLTQRGVGETTAGCTFITPVLEGITTGVGVGIDLRDTFQNVFLGGTSEGNTVGCRQVGANNVGNTFYETDFESNTSQDFLVTGGSNLTFTNINSASLVGGNNIDLQGGDNTTFVGGYLRLVAVATSPTVTGTAFYSCQISDAGGAGIVKAAGAVIKAVGVQKVNGSRVVTSQFNDDVGNIQPLPYTPTIVGGTTPGAQTYAVNGQKGYYTVVGHIVHFSIYLQLTANSGGTGSAVVNLPVAARNLTNGFQNIPICDYTGVTLGAAGRSLSMRITAGNATGTLLETDTGSVSNFILIGAIAATAQLIISGSYQID